MKTILVTGGAGYIGSHVCLELIESGYDVVVIDSLENSSIDALKAIERYTGKLIRFYHDRVQHTQTLRSIFKTHDIHSVIHMAGYKSVKLSCQDPELYYENNLGATIALLKVMHENKCFNLIFSSSATVYGDANGICTEDSPLSVLNPYGETKLTIEKIMDYAVYSHVRNSVSNDLQKFSKYLSEHDIITSDLWNFVSLRYFNPIGAHTECGIGERPTGIPENLVPFVMKVLSGHLPKLTIYGNDYNTRDGTAIRDYIHVIDLAKAHVKALDSMIEYPECYKSHHERFNVGTGKGYSVIEVMRVFEQILCENRLQGNDLDVTLEWHYGERRPGDAEKIYADPTKANDILNWHSERSLCEMCRDAWSYWSSHLNSLKNVS